MTTLELMNLSIKSCLKYYTNGNVHACAIRLAELLEAEENHIIQTKWRKNIDVDKIRVFIMANITEVGKGWEQNYKQLKRIIDYGGRLEYEEMMLVLMLRSNLALAIRFLPDDHQQELISLDDTLKECLQINLQEVRDCKSHKRAGLDHYFATHWWWQY